MALDDLAAYNEHVEKLRACEYPMLSGKFEMAVHLLLQEIDLGTWLILLTLR